MCMRTSTPAVDTRPKFFALPSFRRRVTYAKNFGLGTRLVLCVLISRLRLIATLFLTGLLETSVALKHSLETMCHTL